MRNLLCFLLIVTTGLLDICRSQCTKPSNLDPFLSVLDGPYNEGQFISISCLMGALSGADFTLCVGGSLTNPLEDITCDLDCESPITGQESLGVVGGDTAPYAHHTVVTFQCANDYSEPLAGPDSSTCNNGTWEPDLSQTKCQAPCLAPTGTFQEGNVLLHGSITNLTCTLNEDYALLECNDGVLSDTTFRCPACSRPDDIDTNIVLNSGEDTFYNGEFVSITCAEGSTLSGSAPFTFCSASDGSFQTTLSAITCNLDCYDPALNQTTLLSTGDPYPHHSTASLSCADGYGNIQGANQLTCNNGTWDPSPSSTSCDVFCLSPSNADPEGSYAPGDSVEFTCKYDNSMSLLLTCNGEAGQWNQNLECPDPTTTIEIGTTETTIDYLPTESDMSITSTADIYNTELTTEMQEITEGYTYETETATVGEPEITGYFRTDTTLTSSTDFPTSTIYKGTDATTEVLTDVTTTGGSVVDVTEIPFATTLETSFSTEQITELYISTRTIGTTDMSSEVLTDFTVSEGLTEDATGVPTVTTKVITDQTTRQDVSSRTIAMADLSTEGITDFSATLEFTEEGTDISTATEPSTEFNVSTGILGVTDISTGVTSDLRPTTITTELTEEITNTLIPTTETVNVQTTGQEFSTRTTPMTDMTTEVLTDVTNTEGLTPTTELSKEQTTELEVLTGTAGLTDLSTEVMTDVTVSEELTPTTELSKEQTTELEVLTGTTGLTDLSTEVITDATFTEGFSETTGVFTGRTTELDISIGTTGTGQTQTSSVMIADQTTEIPTHPTTPQETGSTSAIKTREPTERRTTARTTTSPIEEGSTIILEGTWVIEEINGTEANFTEDLHDPNNEAYRNLAEALEMAIRDLLVEQLGLTSLIEVRIDGFSAGSIVVDFTLIFNTNFTGNASVLQDLIIEAVNADDGFVNGTLSPTVLRLIAELIRVIDITSSTEATIVTTEGSIFLTSTDVASAATTDLTDTVTELTTLVLTTDVTTDNSTDTELIMTNELTGSVASTRSMPFTDTSTDLTTDIPSSPQTISTAETELTTIIHSSGTDKTLSTDLTSDPNTDTQETTSTIGTVQDSTIISTGTLHVVTTTSNSQSTMTGETSSTNIRTDPISDATSTSETIPSLSTGQTGNTIIAATKQGTTVLTTYMTLSTDLTTDLTTDSTSTSQTTLPYTSEPVTTHIITGIKMVTSSSTLESSTMTGTPSMDSMTGLMTEPHSTPQTMSTHATESVTTTINTETETVTASTTDERSTLTDGHASTDSTVDLTTVAVSTPSTMPTPITSAKIYTTEGADKTTDGIDRTTSEGLTTLRPTSSVQTTGQQTTKASTQSTERRATTKPATTSRAEPCGNNTCGAQEFCSSIGSVCECLPGILRQDNGQCSDECNNTCDFDTELCEGSECACRPGRRRDPAGNCENFLEYSVSWTIFEVNGTKANLTDDLTDPSSEAYQTLAEVVSNAIRELLLERLSEQIGEGTLIEVQINGFREGSIIADFTIAFTSALLSKQGDNLQSEMYNQIKNEDHFANDTSTSTSLLMLQSASGLVVTELNDGECTDTSCDENAVCVIVSKTENPDGFVCECTDGFTNVLQGDSTSILDCREDTGTTEQPSSGLAPWEAIIIALSTCAVAALLSFFCCLAYMLRVQRRRYYKQRFQDDLRPDPQRKQRRYSNDDIILRKGNYYDAGMYAEERGADGPMFFAKVFDGSESLGSSVDSALDPEIERYGHSLMRMRQPPGRGPNVLPETALVTISSHRRSNDRRANEGPEFSPDLLVKEPGIIFNDLAMH
ncbi:mucin-3A-like [Lytechinus pictus]|uniref:mucin-3A-like n=1 Tax=Lytechinus pictus TaxID=7653 RepID=UPI0030B9BAE5